MTDQTADGTAMAGVPSLAFNGTAWIAADDHGNVAVVFAYLVVQCGSPAPTRPVSES